MDSSLFLSAPPALHSTWLAHEESSGLVNFNPVYANPRDRQPVFAAECRDLNKLMLATVPYEHLKENLNIEDCSIVASDNYLIPVRIYTPHTITGDHSDLVIYYHGGGIHVGDLDSEDLSCRRICIEGGMKVVSVAYRLMPDYTPDRALDDAWEGFQHFAKHILCSEGRTNRLILVGSSSGGQLAAQVSQLADDNGSSPITGVLLRCPVTVDGSNGKEFIPVRFKPLHHSFSPAFQTCLLRYPPQTLSKKTTRQLPLSAKMFGTLPKTWLQVCTNDFYYSDGVCYAQALREAGVDVKLDVAFGWPHTFWLKAPGLEEAVQAEQEMIRGLKWLLADN